MQRLFKILIIITLTGLTGSSARDVAFQWPDSSHYWRALVNVNQYIASYIKNHPQWFSRDKLVTDFSVIDVPAREDAAKQYKTVRKLMESRGMYVGVYVSGSTVLPESEQSHYPPAAVSIEQMPPTARYVGSWPGHPTRKIINVADAETRHAFQARIREIWETTRVPIRYVDNIPPHPKMLKVQPWAASCKHMEELRRMGESLGSRVMFNIPMLVGDLSDEEARQLIEAVGQGGISLEMPWHFRVRQSKEATERTAKRYRQLLDSGMAILMIPVKTPEDELTNWVRSWRKPTDHIYLSGPFWKAPDLGIYTLQQTQNQLLPAVYPRGL